jgi:TonB family protein
MNLRGFICLALLMSFSPLRVWTQTDHLQDELNSAYKGKTLLLRNFYSGDTLAYGSDGQLRSPSILRIAAWTSSIEKRDPTASPATVSPGTVSAPRAIHSPDPKYTKDAKSRHFEGMSRLMLMVNRNGIAENIAILDPLGMGLDEQAVRAVREWRFQPAMKNGQPVRVQINIKMVFRCCP